MSAFGRRSNVSYWRRSTEPGALGAAGTAQGSSACVTRQPLSKAAQTIRCALYTRKSSDEGLDQAFNSLHAQREACEAYVKSQVGETRAGIHGFNAQQSGRPGVARAVGQEIPGYLPWVVGEPRRGAEFPRCVAVLAVWRQPVSGQTGRRGRARAAARRPIAQNPAPASRLRGRTLRCWIPSWFFVASND